jgi:hypothetical protein
MAGRCLCLVNKLYNIIAMFVLSYIYLLYNLSVRNLGLGLEEGFLLFRTLELLALVLKIGLKKKKKENC